MSSLGHQRILSKLFFWEGGGKLHFLKDNLSLYGYKLTNEVAYLTWYRNQLQCALMMNVSSDAVFWFHLTFLLLCCLVFVLFIFSFSFWILVLLKESVLMV